MPDGWTALRGREPNGAEVPGRIEIGAAVRLRLTAQGNAVRFTGVDGVVIEVVERRTVPASIWAPRAARWARRAWHTRYVVQTAQERLLLDLDELIVVSP